MSTQNGTAEATAPATHDDATDAATVTATALPVSFTTPPFGLDPLVDFVLDPLGAGLHALRGPGEVRLFVLDAAVHLPEYSPELTDEQAGSLGLEDASDALLLVVATPGETGTTVNLLAPVVVHRGTGRAAQVILEGQDQPLRAELAAR